MINKLKEKITSLIRIGVRGDNYGKIVGVENNTIIKGPSPAQKKKALQEARSRYLDGLRMVCLQLPLVPLGHARRHDKKVTLRQVYIELDTTTRVQLDGSPMESPNAKAQRTEKGMNDDETRLLKIQEAVHRHPCTIILGDPGSGKSSFLKYYLAQFTESDQKLLPVLITLRNLAARLQPGNLPEEWQQRQAVLVQQVIQAAAKEHAMYLDETYLEAFEQEVRSGQCILAFDGLDEVPVEQRAVLREAIQAMHEVKKTPEQIIVTCRVRSYNGESVFEGYPTYTLSTLTQDQMESFASAWYTALAESGAYTLELAKTRGRT